MTTGRLLILIALLIICGTVAPQAPYLYFNRLTTQNGLSHNKVNCILQDQRGFMWLGTDDGLNRYDGRYFTTFRHRPDDSTTISGNIITSLLEDEEGILWIGTADGGLTRYDYKLPSSKQFKQYRHLPGDSSSIPVNIINDLLQDRFGYLWIATGTRWVLRFNKKTGKFDEPAKVGTRNALNLCLDKNDILWVGRQGGGILKINTKDLSYEMDKRYGDLYANLPHATVSSLFRDKEDNMWFGSWDKVLYRFAASTQQEEKFEQDKSGTSFPNDDVQAFAEDQLGRLWMGGRYDGLTLYDKAQKKFFNYRYDVSREGTIADNHINCIFIDRSGMLWLGTGKGLSVYNPLQQPFAQTFLPAAGKDISIYDFYKDEHKTLWIGTNEGLFLQKSGNSSLEHRPLSYQGHSLTVSKFFKDDDGTLYLGTNFSLFRYDPATNALSLLPNTEKDPVIYNIIDSRIVSIVKENIEGHPCLLVSPYGHYLVYYDFIDKRWVSRTDSVRNILERFNLRDNLFRKLYKTPEGKTWLATSKSGLAELKNGTIPRVEYYRNDPGTSESISNDNVYDINSDAKGNLWVSTYGGGLNYFDVTTKKFTHIDITNNLLEGLQTDARGSVWMISNGNLHKYDPKLRTYSSFMLPDLEKSGGVKGNMYKDADGSMYIAGNNYFINFEPAGVRSIILQPKVYFTDFKIFNHSNNDLLSQKTIQLGHEQNYFTVEFSAPDFGGSPVEYSYMLEGFDKDWIDAGDRNSASYSNLETKDYVFKVRASNKKSNWSSEYASIRIAIIPPFWKRIWFFILCALVTAAAIYGMYRYRINELVKRQTIRNKIAQDLHDNVGSTLSSISVYSQVAKIYHRQEKQGELHEALEKISTASSEMISEMNDIVWAINPRNDNMNVILQRMESYASPLLQAKDIRFKFEYDPGLLNLQLAMEQRKNFYLIFKEAVNNVLKYSCCRHLHVQVRAQNRRIELRVQDDGKGFDTEQMKVLAAKSLSGNGLVNMKRRAADMNGECYISSDPGKGTTVLLRFLIP
jgi:ligand-binding sensor domain-containing protein/signal transduction histidine kinase